MSDIEQLAFNLAMVAPRLKGREIEAGSALRQVAALLSEGAVDYAHELALDALHASRRSAKFKAGHEADAETYLLMAIVALLITARASRETPDASLHSLTTDWPLSASDRDRIRKVLMRDPQLSYRLQVHEGAGDHPHAHAIFFFRI
ncbi:MAG: hypothetical protein ABI702_03580 [Burkholderiales bacterium]